MKDKPINSFSSGILKTKDSSDIFKVLRKTARKIATAIQNSILSKNSILS